MRWFGGVVTESVIFEIIVWSRSFRSSGIVAELGVPRFVILLGVNRKIGERQTIGRGAGLLPPPASNLEREGSPSAVVATSQRDGRTIDRRDPGGRRPLWRLHYSQPLRRRRVRPALTAAYSNQSSHTPPHAGSFVRSAVRKRRAEIVARLH